MSKVMIRILGGCGLLPRELVIALVRIWEKASHVPNPWPATRTERILVVNFLRQDQESEREDPAPAADPARIPRQTGAEKFHHLAASKADLAPLTLERGSRVPPCHPRRDWAEKLSAEPPSWRGFGPLVKRKLSATTPLLVPMVGHPGGLQGGEERLVGSKLLLVPVPVGAPCVLLAPPPWEAKMDSSPALP